MTMNSDPSRPSSGVTHAEVVACDFERRGLRRSAGIWLLWALGVGAVISGHFSGWKMGLASGGWGGMMIAAAMFLRLPCGIVQMSAALPLSGGSYSYTPPRGTGAVRGMGGHRCAGGDAGLSGSGSDLSGRRGLCDGLAGA